MKYLAVALVALIFGAQVSLLQLISVLTNLRIDCPDQRCQWFLQKQTWASQVKVLSPLRPKALAALRNERTRNQGTSSCTINAKRYGDWCKQLDRSHARFHRRPWVQHWRDLRLLLRHLRFCRDPHLLQVRLGRDEDQLLSLQRFLLRPNSSHYKHHRSFWVSHLNLIIRYCDFNSILTAIEPYFALDYARMADQVTRVGIASFLDFPKYAQNLKEARASGDYWNVGYEAGKIF